MQRSAIPLIFVIALVIFAGCTQNQPAVPQVITTQPTATSEVQATTGVTAQTIATPAATVTVIHYVETQKAWKDSTHQFTFRAPESWAVTTHQMTTPDDSQGLLFQTDLVQGDVFTIQTFPISRNQDQAYRNAFRKWAPAPDETTVTINTIVFDRFESTRNGKTQVGYVARKSSANDLGYSSVIYFIADGSTPFEKDDFEEVVQSFAYLSKKTAITATGYEIPRVR